MTDSSAARAVRPSLTTLDLHPAEVGRATAEMLIALVDGEEPAEHVHVVPTRLVKRGSSSRTP